ncbi:MAG: hypothetical protein K8R21_01980, partial [Leptospira sp.]|nr:hypothetical protein [Leptospira sp.]
MPYKYRVPVFIFAISMLTFLIFIVTEDLFWAKESFKTNPGKLYLGKIFIAISLSSLSSLISFVIVNTIDNSIKGLGGIIADWAENISEESDLSESVDAEIENEEISEIARSFKIATLQNKDREDNMVKELLSIHSSDTANSLQSFLFQVDLAQIRKFDVSIFPKVSENASCDFVSVMETSAGCIGMMAGFPHADAVEVGVKFRLDGVLSGLSKVNDVSAVDLISAAEFAVRKIRAQNMNLSMFLI